MKLMFFLLVPLLAYSQKGRLERLELNDVKSVDPIYNPVNDKLLYQKIEVNDLGKYVTLVVIRDMKEKTEKIIATDLLYPALGWLDTSRVLIYRTFPGPSKSKKLFSKDYGRKLFILNVTTNEQVEIDSASIPLRFTDNDIIIDRKYLVYNKSESSRSEISKFDLETKERSIFPLPDVYVNYTNFDYRSSDNRLIFVTNDGSDWRLSCNS